MQFLILIVGAFVPGNDRLRDEAKTMSIVMLPYWSKWEAIAKHVFNEEKSVTPFGTALKNEFSH